VRRTGSLVHKKRETVLCHLSASSSPILPIMPKYELPLTVTVDNVPNQSITLVMETFDTVMLKSATHLYILKDTKQGRELGALSKIYDMFVCKALDPSCSYFTSEHGRMAPHSWFKMSCLSTNTKPGWVWLPEVTEPSMAIVEAPIEYGWRGQKGDHTASDLFTFIRIAL